MARVELAGKPIVISGASSGIGAATAVASARAGMPVALGARRLEQVEEVARTIRSSGGRAFALRTDVTNPDDCRKLVDACAAEFGSVYAVFANAGYGEESPLHRMPDDRVRAMFETNLFGSLNLVRPALERMLAAERAGHGPRGHVLWCSSCLARMSLPYFSVYCATKAAQAHMASAMRLELKDEGVYVSSVHPIGTKTEFSMRVMERGGGLARKSLMVPGMFTQRAETVAARVVACLRRPRPEVWPGPAALSVRWAMALVTGWPGVGDFALGIAKRRAERA